MLFLFLSLFAATIVAVDQITKYVTVTNIAPSNATMQTMQTLKDTFDLTTKKIEAMPTEVDAIPGLFQFSHYHNQGGAWSLFDGMMWLFILAFAVLTVLICHFGRNPEEQRVALDTIRTELSDMTEPTVLMGDFNLPPHSEYYSPLAAMLRDTAEPPALPLTFPSEDPTCKIDYLFVSDSVIAHNVTVPDTQQSDHRPYFAEIEI